MSKLSFGSEQVRYVLSLVFVFSCILLVHRNFVDPVQEFPVGLQMPAANPSCANLATANLCEAEYGCSFVGGNCVDLYATPISDIKGDSGFFSSHDTYAKEGVWANKAGESWYARDKIYSGIQGFACAIGGAAGEMRDFGAMWGVFQVWQQYNAQANTLEAFIQGTSIGSSSGGGWFVNDLLWNPKVTAVFQTGKTLDDLRAVGHEIFTQIRQSIWANDPKGMFWESFAEFHSSLIGTVVSGFRTVEALAMQHKHGGGTQSAEGGVYYQAGFEKFLNEAHPDYGSGPSATIDVDFYQSTLIPPSNCNYRETQQSGDLVARKYEIEGLGSDLAMIPVYIKYNPNTAPTDVTANVPMLDRADAPSLSLKSYQDSEGSGDPAVTPLNHATLKTAIENWPKNRNHPPLDFGKILAAPTSNLPGSLSIGNGPTINIVMNANIGAMSVRTAPIAPGACGVCMADSGTTDPLGLAVAIKGMQDRTPDQQKVQKIAVFSNSMVREFSPYIASIAERTPSISELQDPHPWAVIFGKFRYGKMLKIHDKIRIYTIIVETKADQNWGIKAGYVYELVIIGMTFNRDTLPKNDDVEINGYADDLVEIARTIKEYKASSVTAFAKVASILADSRMMDFILVSTLLCSAFLLFKPNSKKDAELYVRLKEEEV